MRLSAPARGKTATSQANKIFSPDWRSRATPSFRLLYDQGHSSNFPLMKFSPLIWFSLIVALTAEAVTAQQGSAAEDVRLYQSEALSHYLDGDLYMMQGDHSKAVEAYTQALRFDSTSATIYISLGQALLKTQQPGKAYLAGLKALKLEPEDPLAHKFAAEAAAGKNELAQAIIHINDWAKLDPGDIEPLFRKSGTLLQLKRYGEAIDTYLAIYDKNPMQEQVLTRAGEIALSLKDYERSYQVYNRLRQTNPDDVRVMTTFAEVAVRTNRSKEAIATYEALLSSGRASPGNRMQLAWLYSQAGEGQRALDSMLDLVQEGHRQWEVLRLTARTASDLPDYEALVDVAQLMMDVYPDSLNGYTAMAFAKSHLDDNDGAIAALESGRRKIALNVDVSYMLGNLYYTVGRTLEAVEQLRLALKIEPGAVPIKQLLAATLSDLGQYEQSDSLYEILLSGDQEDAISLNNYAYSMAERAIVTKKQLKYAFKLSKRSQKLKKNESAFLDTYGWILYRQGKLRRAQKHVARSLKLNPKSATVLEHMATILSDRGRDEQAQIYAARAAVIRSNQDMVTGEQE